MTAYNQSDWTSLDCPSFTRGDSYFLVKFSFWVEGVAQTSIATLGILGNLISCLILTRKDMRNSFNLLLVTLAAYDIWYLFGAILESFRKSFNLASDLHILMFPYFLYPLHQTSMTGSIFMTVAIAFERYSAVHFPINYSQSLNEKSAVKKRLFQYLLPVGILAFLFNVPKFLEADIAYEAISPGKTSLVEYNETINRSYNHIQRNLSNPIDLWNNGSYLHGNENFTNAEKEVDWQPYLRITPLRTNPIYSNYNNWSRLLLLGILPFLLLVFFNAKIYSDVKERRRRQLILRNTNRSSPENATVRITLPSQAQESLANLQNVEYLNPEGLSAFPSNNLHEHMELRPMISNASDISPRTLQVRPPGRSFGSWKEGVTRLPRRTIRMSIRFQRAGGSLIKSTFQRSAANTSRSSSVLTSSTRRKNEDNLAVIFMGIILIFLICHFPRILLNIYELATIHRSLACELAKRPQFSLWSLLMISVSHVLLVVNSATNMIVYCVLSRKFRIQFKKFIKGSLPPNFCGMVSSQTSTTVVL